MKILIATAKPFTPVTVNIMRQIMIDEGFTVRVLEKYDNSEMLYRAVEDIDGIIVRSDKVTSLLLDFAKNLKVVVRAGSGYDNIDVTNCTTRNIAVLTTPGQNALAVAELALGMMIFISRNTFLTGTGNELSGKDLGLHAFGNVGQKVGQLGKNMGMNVFAYDPMLRKPEMNRVGVKVVSTPEELYRTCQYISLHLPVTPQTYHSIDYNLMSKMPKGATLVNTARKELINENDLQRVMEERQDFRYITDVMPTCHELLASKYKHRYFATPGKIGAETHEANINAGVAAAKQLVAFLKNNDKTFQINLEQ